MIRIRRLALTALAAVALAMGAPAAPALAGSQPRPGAACSTVGATATIDTAAGEQVYRCEQRDGDPCPLWHWQYNAGVPKGQHRPHRCPTCPSASPSVSTSPSASVSASAGPSTPSSGSPSTSAVATPSTSTSVTALAVTGTPTGAIAVVGMVLVGAGWGLVLLFRRRRESAAT